MTTDATAVPRLRTGYFAKMGRRPIKTAIHIYLASSRTSLCHSEAEKSLIWHFCADKAEAFDGATCASCVRIAREKGWMK